MTFFNNPERLWKLAQIMLGGLNNTLSIFAITLVLSLPLGLLIALGRMSKNKLVSRIVSFYIYIMRGTPLILQIMFIYFVVPQIMPFKTDRFLTVIFAFVINYAAYFAEIFRSGIQSIPVGQREAAQVLGYKRGQTFIRIILPQAIRNVMPSMTNEVITLVKDTALASTVAIAEIMVIAKQQASNSSSAEPYLMAAIIYLVLNGIAEQLCKLVERKINYY
ncbi:amino acid ABC transporter permease [Eubacteriales bacterium OttesenSCG-928-N13]|nr:amino acid ABC transporter permease [Eubacteriales bacterium OttesenSCG-928-N13]